MSCVRRWCSRQLYKYYPRLNKALQRNCKVVQYTVEIIRAFDWKDSKIHWTNRIFRIGLTSPRHIRSFTVCSGVHKTKHASWARLMSYWSKVTKLSKIVHKKLRNNSAPWLCNWFQAAGMQVYDRSTSVARDTVTGSWSVIKPKPRSDVTVAVRWCGP